MRDGVKISLMNAKKAGTLDFSSSKKSFICRDNLTNRTIAIAIVSRMPASPFWTELMPIEAAIDRKIIIFVLRSRADTNLNEVVMMFLYCTARRNKDRYVVH